MVSPKSARQHAIVAGGWNNELLKFRPPYFLSTMRQKIITTAQKKLLELNRRYNGFMAVILDNWRGYRFIYDTVDVRRCQNNCTQCPLFRLLANEKDGAFTARLLRASPADRRLFGPQKYLNCKTISQYRMCYKNFIAQKIATQKELTAELRLVQGLRVLYAKERDPLLVEQEIKRNIINFSARWSPLSAAAGKSRRKSFDSLLKKDYTLSTL